jgi:integrase
MKQRKPRIGSVYQRGRTYWIKYYRRGQPFRESTHSDSYEEAERLLKRRQGEVVTGKFVGLASERVRFGELAQEVLADYRDNQRATVGDVERRIRLYLEPAFGNVRAADFSTGQIKHYIADRRKAGASNATINRELAVVKRAFHLAAQNDPPLVGRVPHIPMLEEKNVRKGFLEYESYCRLRDALPAYLRLLLVVGYYVGCRVGELLQIQWPQVDLMARRIRLEPGTTKGEEGRTLPIYNGEMLEWLRMAREVRDTRYPECSAVFHREGEAIKSFKNSWATACARAALPGLLFHDLRRTAVRNMVRAGIAEKIAMQISGHNRDCHRNKNPLKAHKLN